MNPKIIRIDTLSNNDVISFKSGEYTSRIGHMLNKFKMRFSNHRRSLHFHNIFLNAGNEINASNSLNQHVWFEDGEECELLTVGQKGWQKGRFRVKLSLEFIPDEDLEEDSELKPFRENIERFTPNGVPVEERQDSIALSTTNLDACEESNWPPEPMN